MPEAANLGVSWRAFENYQLRYRYGIGAGWCSTWGALVAKVQAGCLNMRGGKAKPSRARGLSGPPAH